MTLKTRFTLAFIGYTCVVLGVFGATYYMQEGRAVRAQQASDRARTLETLVTQCAGMQLAENPIAILDYVTRLKNNPTVRWAACLDAAGIIKIHSNPKLIGEPFIDELGTDAAAVFVGQKQAGSARVAYDQSLLNRERKARLKATLRQLAWVTGSTLLLAVMIALALAWSLLRPIGRLVQAVRTIAAGEWTPEASPLDRKDELGYLAREVDAMARSLAILDELKDNFIASVSHELRNPMSAIKMYAEYMLNEDEDKDKLLPKHRDVFSIIVANSTRLSVYVTNILDTAKIKAGRMEHHAQPVSLEATAKNVQTLFTAVAKRQNVRLILAIEAGLPHVQADPQRLEQVLINLVSNALKFTLDEGTVTIAAARLGGKIELSVADTGEGMSKENLAQLFQRFRQSSAARHKARGIQGTGLGLYIVKESLDAMGAVMTVHSEPGKGSRFCVLL